MSAWFNWQGEHLILNLRIQPGGRNDEVVGLYGDQLKIKINSPPVDGKANDALIAYLAAIFDVGKRQVEVVSGHTSRSKRIRILAPKLSATHPAPLNQIKPA